MRLSITHTKNNTYFYMIKSYRENGKNKTKIIERLGELKEVEQKAKELYPDSKIIYKWNLSSIAFNRK